MDDATDLTTLDWLGRSQPLARKSLELTSSGGGGGVTAPVTPSAMERAQELVGGASGSPSAANASASDFARAMQAAGLGQRALGVIRRFSEGTPAAASGADLAGRTFGGEPVTPEQALAIRSLGGILGPEGGPGWVPLGAIGAGVEAPAGSAVEAASVAGSGTAAAGEAAPAASAGAGLAEPGVAGTLASEAGVAYNIAQRAQGRMSAGEQANLAAIEALLATTGPGALAIPLVELTLSGKLGGPGSAIDYLTSGALSIWDALYGGGDYIPKRVEAGKEATSDISSLGADYQAAAKSGDLGQVLTALQTTQGGRGAVRSFLSLPEEVAQTIGVPAGNVEWSSLNPAQFGKVLDYFRQHPEALASGISGSGDVAYLPARQAIQVADAAANDARALISFVLSQPAPAAVPTPPTPEPVPPAPFTPSGPSGALGFARELLGTT